MRATLGLVHIQVNKHSRQIGCVNIQVNKSINDGTTPLHAAEGIEINTPDTKVGNTPLIVASAKGHVEIVKLLLGVEGIEINQPANNGVTALGLAKQQEHTEIVQLLIAAGATE